jgi:hypothetical protein
MASSSASPGPGDGKSIASALSLSIESKQSSPHPQYIGLIDVESADGGKSILSECCLIVCRVRQHTSPQWKTFVESCEPVHAASFNQAHQPLEIVEILHHLVAPPPFQQVNMEEVRHVSQFITGLNWETLQRNGIPYLLLVRLLNDCLRKYPGIQLRARDEKLENQLLRRSDVTEVCQLLPDPLAQSFMQQRVNRPLQLKAFCGATFTCHAHHALYDQRLSAHPHCAYADCMEMLAWLQLWGAFDDKAASSEASVLTASVVKVNDRMAPFEQVMFPDPQPMLFSQHQPMMLSPFGYSINSEQHQQQQSPFLTQGDAWPSLADPSPTPMMHSYPCAMQSSPASASSSPCSSQPSPPPPPIHMTPFLCHPSYVYASMVAAAAASAAANQPGQPPQPPLMQPLLWPVPSVAAQHPASFGPHMHASPPAFAAASNALNVWSVAPPALRQ